VVQLLYRHRLEQASKDALSQLDKEAHRRKQAEAAARNHQYAVVNRENTIRKLEKDLAERDEEVWLACTIVLAGALCMLVCDHGMPCRCSLYKHFTPLFTLCQIQLKALRKSDKANAQKIASDTEFIEDMIKGKARMVEQIRTLTEEKNKAVQEVRTSTSWCSTTPPLVPVDS